MHDVPQFEESDELYFVFTKRSLDESNCSIASQIKYLERKGANLIVLMDDKDEQLDEVDIRDLEDMHQCNHTSNHPDNKCQEDRRI